jgi:ubiquitin carboxyl-terminal hydrolase 34
VSRSSSIKSSHSRQIIIEFLFSFIKLTATFVTFDCKTLTSLGPNPPLGQRDWPDLVSPLYLHNLHALAQNIYSLNRRENSRAQNGHLDGDVPWMRSEEISEILNHLQELPGGSIAVLTHLCQLQIDAIPSYPKLADNFGAVCQIVVDFLRDSFRKLQFQGILSPEIAEQARHQLALGYAFFCRLSQALSTNMEKFVNHLTSDGALSQIQTLTDIYQYSLHCDSSAVNELVKSHRQDNPKLPTKLTPEVLAWEWRFDMLGKLIKSSQMQLRVMAVSTMCNDLVTFWKRVNELGEEHNSPFLSYFAEYLLRTGLVDYILGPTCHHEISYESGNIVGFLLVTRFYQKEQTDMLWDTITTSQDPRVVDALLRMTAQISNLYEYDGLLYLCEKLLYLPIDVFTHQVRLLCEQAFKHLINKCQLDRSALSFLPYKLCIRLLRESSICGSHSQVAYPEVQNFAMNSLRELINFGVDTEGRHALYLDCINDISARSRTTLGSLWCLHMSIKNSIASELRILTSQHDLTRLLVEELEHAIEVGRATGSTEVLAGTPNDPRRELIYGIIIHDPETLDSSLGGKLWNMLVGLGASCADDRDFAWDILNNAAHKSGYANSFLSSCFSEYFPTLPSALFCRGALEFVKEYIIPKVNDINDMALDDEENVSHSGIEQLWRIILNAADQDIVERAISVLVSEVYVESRCMLECPQQRALKIHVDLVNRCIGQLKTAANALKAFNEGTSSGDDEPMVIVATESQVQEQERIFIRSLSVLRQFILAHQSKAQFSAPDLRPLTSQPPNSIEGELAGLKYQSFDGDDCSSVKSLNIGRRNTAASLLASLREATGFENYRVYCKGQSFAPNEIEICKSLEDLQIENCLILIKREAETKLPTARIKPGTSSLEIEILGHFEDFWSYLSMEEKLAVEVCL